MALVRSWMSDALRAGLAGLAVPVALLAVLAVLALGGAFGGLSSLGQLVVGPRVPLPAPLPPAPAAHAAGTGTAGLALPAIPRRPTKSGTPAGAAPRVHRNAPAVVHRLAPTHRTTGRPIGHRGPAPIHKVTPAPAPHGSAPSQKPNPGPPPGGAPGTPSQPNPAQQVIQTVQQTLPQVQHTGNDVINTVQQIGGSIKTGAPTAAGPSASTH